MNDSHQKTEAKTESPSIKKLEEFKQLFPGVISDGVLDAGRLGELLQADVSGLKGGKERFGLMWSGKQKAVEAREAESYAALIPDFENSINWDSAQNVFIEGDNLEVLKLLQNAYNDKIKMIYIDPPYNTGNDFVYNDDFSDPKQRYLEVTGQVDAEGNRLTSNTETSGRKHSNWLTMMYPRLDLARNLLTEDGAIFVSIDDNEVHNLRSIMDEIFGPENFIGQFVWAAGRKNDAKFISSSHEYIVCYSRSLQSLIASEGSWRQAKEGLAEIRAKFEKLDKDPSSWVEGSRQLKEWFGNLADSDPSKRHYQYWRIDGEGPYRIDNASAPDRPETRCHKPLIHPETGQPCKVPASGWRWKEETLDQMYEAGRFYFGVDESTVPQVKAYLSDRATETPYSVFYKDGSGSTKRLRDLLEGKFFDFPKDELVLQKIVEFASDSDSIILDFFAGSGTLGHSVEIQNRLDGGNRRYICVTLPEPTNKDSDARKAGIEKVSEITEMRLKKVLDLFDGAKERGLRILRLGPSAFKPHFPSDDSLFVLDESSLEMDPNTEQIAGEVLLRQGVTLDQPWTRVSGIQSGSVKVCDLFGTMEIEQILETEASVLVFLEDSFKGRDALKSELSFAIAQAGKKMVTY
jgi:adenine-specific DNA-methyltransferase